MSDFITAFLNYLTHEKHYSALTVRAYGDDLLSFSDFLKSNSVNVSLEMVPYSHIRLWIVALSADGVSNRSINRKIASLKAFYKFLLKLKVIEVSPLAKHQALKVAKKVQVPFSEAELTALKNIDFPDDYFGVRDQLILELFYTCGIRRAELISLKQSDLDLSTKTLRVLGKRNKERILPLLDTILPIYSKYLQYKRELFGDTTELFLNNKGLKLNDAFVYRIINSYLSQVTQKVKRSPHMLRHSFATHLIDNGADLNSVKELLGHSSLSSTQVYVNSSLSTLKKVYANAHPRNLKNK